MKSLSLKTSASFNRDSNSSHIPNCSDQKNKKILLFIMTKWYNENSGGNDEQTKACT